MSEIHILEGEFNEQLTLHYSQAIKAGFPSPAEDYMCDSLDFNRDLIEHPEATFYGRVEGDSMMEANICDSDIAVIDRSIQPYNSDVIVTYINEEFTIKYFELMLRHEEYIELRPANRNFKPIRVDADDNFEVWDVVVWTFKKWR